MEMKVTVREELLEEYYRLGQIFYPNMSDLEKKRWEGLKQTIALQVYWAYTDIRRSTNAATD